MNKKYTRHDLIIYIFGEIRATMSTFMLMQRLRDVNLNIDAFRPNFKITDLSLGSKGEVERVTVEDGVVTINYIEQGIVKWFQFPKQEKAATIAYGMVNGNAIIEIIRKM